MATALANDPFADAPNNGAAITAPTQPDDPGALLTVEVDDTVAEINLQLIPPATRTDLLRSAVQNYITNRVSTSKSVLKKKNEAFDIYDAAVKNDPLQNLVAQPTGEREKLDVIAIMTTGINALYEGKFGRRVGDGRKSKPQRDPLVTQITRAVVQEVYEKEKKANPQYKYPQAAKKVGGDGLVYLQNRMAERIKDGADPKQLQDYLETRYIKPARQMLGQVEAAPRFKDMEGIL